MLCEGYHGGTVEGKKYFKARPNSGVLVRRGPKFHSFLSLLIAEFEEGFLVFSGNIKMYYDPLEKRNHSAGTP